MPRFEPFRGLRYDLDRASLADVTAPPYDVIDDVMRARLAERSTHNAVRIDLPVTEGGRDRYEVAAGLLADWQHDGVLAPEPEPAFYGYAMTYVDDRGRDRRTVGVIGALDLSPPGEGGVLPHEHTTPKAKSDRLDLQRACRANLSAVWGLSLSAGLTDLCEPHGDVLAAWTDDDAVGHELWTITGPGQVAAVAKAVESQPVVIADGHHRYETSLAYRDERCRADGDAGPAGATMAFVVELADDALTVRPIHRLVSGLPEGFDLIGALEPWFESVGDGDVDEDKDEVLARMSEERALAVVGADRRYRLLRPRPGALDDADDLDSSRLAVALDGMADSLGDAMGDAVGGHAVSFQHGVDQVVRRVADGSAQHGVLLRPATVAQITANAHAERRMPPKTTFFYPKPKTGLVFRLL